MVSAVAKRKCSSDSMTWKTSPSWRVRSRRASRPRFPTSAAMAIRAIDSTTSIGTITASSCWKRTSNTRSIARKAGQKPCAQAGLKFADFPECSWLLSCDLPRQKCTAIADRLQRCGFSFALVHEPPARDDDLQLVSWSVRSLPLERYLPSAVCRLAQSHVAIKSAGADAAGQVQNGDGQGRGVRPERHRSSLARQTRSRTDWALALRTSRISRRTHMVSEGGILF